MLGLEQVGKQRVGGWLGCALSCALGGFASGCGDEPGAPPPPSRADVEERVCTGEAYTVSAQDEQAPEFSCPQGTDAWVCLGSWAVHCMPDGSIASMDNCRAQELACARATCVDDDCVGGCLPCAPRSVECGDDGEVRRCTKDGARFEMSDRCDASAGEHCSIQAGACEDLCAFAAERQSYIGCEYWAVPTLNSHMTEVTDQDGDPLFGPLVDEGLQVPSQRLCNVFKFALVITNSEGVSARVAIANPNEPTRTVTVEPGEVKTVDFPCQPEAGDPHDLSPAFALLGPKDYETMPSMRSPAAAFHITSDVPVTVYQFNPLEFSQEVNSNRVYSYTNDASLLLPAHSLTGNYTVMSRPTWTVEVRPTDMSEEPVRKSYSGFVTITGTAEEPTEVVIESSAYTRASDDGLLPSLAPGDRATVTLAKGETLQLVTAAPSECRGEPDRFFRGIATTYCHVGGSYDLTGTRIRASQPVSVIGGHDCTYVPRNLAACDHLEEAMFPEDVLGTSALVTVAQQINCGRDIPTVVRIVSTTDNNRVVFEPEVHAPVELERGEVVEFEAAEDFRLQADGAIMVGQFLVGQQFEQGNSMQSTERGDPAFSVIAPFEQWRDNYAFLVPETLPDSFVNVIARDGQVVALDGMSLTNLQPIGETGFSATRVAVDAGSHHLSSGATFGITVYGYASFTSYMLPGGLDLYPINGPK